MPSDYAKICRDNLEEYGKGTRHLTFLERLYSERTHFIFELLQNAEDARATGVQFDLRADGLEVRHDGRLFNEKDVRGVCGIAEGTKEDDLTQIGKFGIGFKSVYAYTLRPEIHCGDEHFAIEKYIRPIAADPVAVASPWTTLFVLPFNRDDVSADTACSEIAQRLNTLNSRTMLFLRHVKFIEWSSHLSSIGRYHRQEKPCGPARRISVIGERKDRRDEETWLVFEAPITSETCVDPLRVEAAFSLVRDEKTGRENVARLDACELSVFFPTEKLTGLGFLIQGPYRTTPARDNVPKDDEWNRKLVAETATLVASTLAQLPDLGMLTVGSLRTLPIRQADFLPGTMFRPIFESVATALRTRALIPTDSGDFVNPKDVKIARAGDLRNLFPSETLTSLLGAAQRIQWVTAEITEARTPDLYSYFRQVLNIEEVTPEAVVAQLDQHFLEATSDEWMRRFYEFLAGQEALWRKPLTPRDAPGPARSAPIIRLNDDRQVPPFRADGSPAVYLDSRLQWGDVPLVKAVFLTSDSTRAFFQKLGLGEFDIVATVREKFLPVYRDGSPPYTVEDHLGHIRLIDNARKKLAAEKRTELISLVRDTPIVLSRNAGTGIESYRKPGEVYDENEELAIYFAGNPSAWFLSQIYTEEFSELLRDLGVARAVRVSHPNKPDSANNTNLPAVKGSFRRGKQGFDPEFTVDGLRYAVSFPTPKRSAYVWETIARPHCPQIRGDVERSNLPNFYRGTSALTWSNMGKTLSECAWLPSSEGVFVKPAMFSFGELPHDFSPDEQLARQLGMKMDDEAILAKKAGVDVETLILAKQIAKDEELYAQVRELIDAKAKKPDFPSRPIPNPDQRAHRLARELATAPLKTYEERSRSVRTSEPAYNPATWLREAYTNTAGLMVCQICREEMPFKKRDGQYYFESVESVNILPQEHQALYLALCPLCAAKYTELVKRDPAALERFQAAVKLASEPVVSVQLGNEVGSVRFVDSHFLDLQTLLRAS
ncbi:MAG: hypothetical protein LAQ69_12350 [Acidobacteriia bacterium]|nr:hypothetical protein [Terriglobia bacterium]